MTRRSSLRQNLGLHTAYQVISTCLPLITAPYLSRTLGAAQQGIFSYTSSIVNYFVLFAAMGVSGYGTRSIAAAGEDMEKRSRVFWSIYTMQLMTSVAMLLAYVLYLTFFCKENKTIAQIQTIALLSCVFGVGWLFFGLEQFKITVTRSFIVRLLTVGCILLFVKNKNDLWKYTLIMVSGGLISDAIFWFYLPRAVSFYRPAFREVLSHFKPNIALFLPLLAMSVYHLMDKTMLGKLSTYEQSGYYYNADKIINIPLSVISGISTVMLPRMSALLGEGKKNEADALFKLSLEGTIAAGTPIFLGIAAIANEFVPVFFGKGFEACIMLTIVLSPVLLIKSYSFTARSQYLVPYKRERDYTVSVIAGAVVNLVLNALLIPRLGAMGAVIGTLLAELVACLWQYALICRMIDLRKAIANCFGYGVIGIMMFLAVRFAARINCVVYGKIAIEILVGVLVYGIGCILFWRFTNGPLKSLVFKHFSAFFHLKKNVPDNRE